MEDYELHRFIYDYIKEICHYSQMQVFATSLNQKNYYQQQIDEVINELIHFINESTNDALLSICQSGRSEQRENEEAEIEHQKEGLREFTLEELAEYNGRNKKPAYVVVDGMVYDVSEVMRWAGGNHFGLHAGKDLTDSFKTCHGGAVQRLQKLPVVGTLKR